MNHNSLPERLKELRSIFEYSQAYVAEKLSISRQTYSHYETGRIMPPPDSLYALAGLYHVTVDMLLTDQSGQPEKRADTRTAHMITNSELFPTYIDYVSNPENKKRFSNLTPYEKKLLFYYSLLDERDQNDILSFMEVKYHNRKEGH